MQPDQVDSLDASSETPFSVTLEVFSGPFDLLLQLIAKHELDITDIALSKVTDEFIAHVAGLETLGELDQASEFIVVAATLLDMKLVSLLPQGEYVDADDVAVLEARDLLFAKLLQYRAFKQAATWFAEQFDAESTRNPRTVPLEAKFRERIPELVWTLSLDDFAAMAALAFAPKQLPTIGLDHLHAPLVSIREQAAQVVRRLREGGPATFRELVADADAPGVVIARFIAVLELYRRSAVELEQESPLGELLVRWEATEWHDDELGTLGADYDR
ncbi:segregation/condensation protein A [Gulosibacter macacae]|uniref:Segregation and condensation protein A n=1 Tax=Gulosibacter macacae TaxID=2488791 RepID=A0A3P3VSA3_9MICO|nr:ScpA family protein [Gulosibacter macacae]RRJ85671.1 segregation/condensation protein A [Gulosibacter macacae]